MLDIKMHVHDHKLNIFGFWTVGQPRLNLFNQLYADVNDNL